MDVQVSRKITRQQPSGSVMVLASNISDLYPVFGDASNPNLITDVEVLDDARMELLDRSMWAVMKQRGGDPLNLTDGNQIEECLMGEISPIVLIGQISASVLKEGPGVQASFSTSIMSNREYLTVSVTLVPAA